MDKQEFLYLIKEIIKENPGWLSDTILALQAGVIEKIHDDAEQFVKLEVAFMTALDKKPDKRLLLEGLNALRGFVGTEWQREQIEKLSKGRKPPPCNNMRPIKFRAWQNGMMVQNKTGVYALKQFLDTLYEDCILMQYTGLKDKNGKEIYEGDIVENEYDNLNYVVAFLNGGFLFRRGDKNIKNLEPTEVDYGKELEVIGNIYENKNLLTGA